MDRAEISEQRDTGDTSGTTEWCSVAGARSQAATIAAFAHDATVRACAYTDAVEALERQTGRARMARNVAASRALHPAIVGLPRSLPTLRRMGIEGCTILAEAGPADDINRWTKQLVFASTDANAPEPSQPAAAPAVREPERGC